MVRTWLKSGSAVLAVVVVLMAASVTRADLLKGQPIFAQNNTDNPIWVAARYVPPGSTSYVNAGWWRVEPGERVLILYNNGRYIYFNAHDNQGADWSGNEACGVVRGERVNMFREDTGCGYECWTMNFNPPDPD